MIPKSISKILLSMLAIGLLAGCQKTISLGTEPVNSDSGTIKLTFRNQVGNTPLVLNTATYNNPFGESFTINKFKYYISNVKLGLSGVPTIAIETESYHLIDQGLPASLSFSFPVAEGKFISLLFLVGVDSTRNVSGAQTGALDPLNDMFWTWNSGYIMAKLEGTSPQSNQAGNKIEYHIGGFKGANNVLKPVSILLPGGKFIDARKGEVSEIILEADLQTWWQGIHDLRIGNSPVITTPGILAKNMADNYAGMFTITDVINY